MFKANTERNSKNHISYFRNGINEILEILYLINVLISVTTVFEGSSPNFNVVHKADNVHHSSLIVIVGKEKKEKNVHEKATFVTSRWGVQDLGDNCQVRLN